MDIRRQVTFAIAAEPINRFEESTVPSVAGRHCLDLFHVWESKGIRGGTSWQDVVDHAVEKAIHSPEAHLPYPLLGTSLGVVCLWMVSAPGDLDGLFDWEKGTWLKSGG